jgi:hypothetical protein
VPVRRYTRPSLFHSGGPEAGQMSLRCPGGLLLCQCEGHDGGGPFSLYFCV